MKTFEKGLIEWFVMNQEITSLIKNSFNKLNNHINLTLLENKAAIKLVDKILSDLDKTGINTDTLIDDIKALRAYALEEQIPLVVKVLRLTYEHIEANNSFLIPIPQDEAEDVEEDLEENEPVESLKYLLSLIKNLNNKVNISDLKDYRDLLSDY